MKRDEPVDPSVQRLLEQRAALLRQKPQGLEQEAVVWVAEFRVGEETCAIPLPLLRAAVPLRMVTPVPLSPPYVLGVLRFQGQILTAMSLASLLGVRGWRVDPAVLLVVEKPGTQELAALDCEETPRPLALPSAAVEEAMSRSQGVSVELSHEGRVIMLLDLKRLLEKREQRHGN